MEYISYFVSNKKKGKRLDVFYKRHIRKVEIVNLGSPPWRDKRVWEGNALKNGETDVVDFHKKKLKSTRKSCFKVIITDSMKPAGLCSILKKKKKKATFQTWFCKFFLIPWTQMYEKEWSQLWLVNVSFKFHTSNNSIAHQEIRDSEFYYVLQCLILINRCF